MHNTGNLLGGLGGQEGLMLVPGTNAAPTPQFMRLSAQASTATHSGGGQWGLMDGLDGGRREGEAAEAAARERLGAWGRAQPRLVYVHARAGELRAAQLPGASEASQQLDAGAAWRKLRRASATAGTLGRSSTKPP